MTDGNLRWPEGFCDIGGRTFEWVFKNRNEFVDFTVSEMKQATGLFRKWQNYCVNKQIEDGEETKKVGSGEEGSGQEGGQEQNSKDC